MLTPVIALAYFNPRSREGSDSRLPASVPPPSYFNPRSREGSDDLTVNANHETTISIHAPARGATGVGDVYQF